MKSVNTMKLEAADKFQRMNMLYDLYGNMLTDKQRGVFALYYNEDLSLAEISEQRGISPQAVKDSLDRAAAKLEGIEEKLRLLEGLAEVA
jgi:predicted DNA-binding protein YlxM (UPF0122 family)